MIKCLLNFIYWTPQLPAGGGGAIIKSFCQIGITILSNVLKKPSIRDMQIKGVEWRWTEDKLLLWGEEGGVDIICVVGEGVSYFKCNSYFGEGYQMFSNGWSN